MKNFFHTTIAHRGLWDLEKLRAENSMESFRAALDRKLPIEIDVHLTKDKQLVVFHDYSLMRICDTPLIVEETDYPVLREYYLSHTSSHIPLLKEVLDCVDGRVPLLIELKLPCRDTELCQQTYMLLANYNGPYLIQSFNTLVLGWFRKNAPHVLRGQLSCALTKEQDDTPLALRFLIQFLLLNCYGKPDFISYKYMDRHNLSLQICRHLFRTPVAVWTLRNPKDFTFAKNHYEMVIFENCV